MLGEDISESGAKGKVSNTDPMGHGLSFISSKAWTRHACSFLVEGTCPLGMDGDGEGHLRQLHFALSRSRPPSSGAPVPPDSCIQRSFPTVTLVALRRPHAQPPCRNQMWWQQRAQMAPAASTPTRPNSPFLK